MQMKTVRLKLLTKIWKISKNLGDFIFLSAVFFGKYLKNGQVLKKIKKILYKQKKLCYDNCVV